MEIPSSETPRYSHDVEVATLNFYEALAASVELSWNVKEKSFNEFIKSFCRCEAWRKSS